VTGDRFRLLAFEIGFPVERRRKGIRPQSAFVIANAYQAQYRKIASCG
jgi:hypothetical protein